MAGSLNISALARRTGVAPDTLRKWEQRYGVLRPERTAGGQRRYTEHDIARVAWLRDRLAEGWRIGEAARLLDETSAPPFDDPTELRDALAHATSASDLPQVGALLDQAFAVLPLFTVLDDVVAPFLRWVGDAWHAGELSVAQEHAVAAKVRARLELLMADERGGPRGIAVVACAPGEQHDLGALVLAVALRADGWRVEYLGANAPVEHTLALAGSVGASLVCVSASRADTLAQLEQGLAEEASSGVTLALGGAAVRPRHAEALGAVHADGALGEVVRRLRTAGA